MATSKEKTLLDRLVKLCHPESHQGTPTFNNCQSLTTTHAKGASFNVVGFQHRAFILSTDYVEKNNKQLLPLQCNDRTVFCSKNDGHDHFDHHNKITAMACFPMVHRQRQCDNPSSTYCLCVGYETGFVDILTFEWNSDVQSSGSQQCYLLCRRQFCSSKTVNSFASGGSTNNRSNRAIFIVYDTLIVQIESHDLFKTLTVNKKKLAVLFSEINNEQGERNTILSAHLLSRIKHKHLVVGRRRATSMFSRSTILKDMCFVDNPDNKVKLNAMFHSGNPSRILQTPPYLLVTVGSYPVLQFNSPYSLESLRLNELATSVVSTVTSGLFRMASSYIFKNDEDTNKRAAVDYSHDPDIDNKVFDYPTEQIVHCLSSFPSSSSSTTNTVATRLKLSKSGKLLAVTTDDQHRIMVFDVDSKIMIKLFKGYHSCQIAWKETFTGGCDLLVILLVNRGILELWSLNENIQAPFSVFKVPSNSSLIDPIDFVLSDKCEGESTYVASSCDDVAFFDNMGNVYDICVEKREKSDFASNDKKFVNNETSQFQKQLCSELTEHILSKLNDFDSDESRETTENNVAKFLNELEIQSAFQGQNLKSILNFYSENVCLRTHYVKILEAIRIVFKFKDEGNLRTLHFHDDKMSDELSSFFVAIFENVKSKHKNDVSKVSEMLFEIQNLDGISLLSTLMKWYLSASNFESLNIESSLSLVIYCILRRDLDIHAVDSSTDEDTEQIDVEFLLTFSKTCQSILFRDTELGLSISSLLHLIHAVIEACESFSKYLYDTRTCYSICGVDQLRDLIAHTVNDFKRAYTHVHSFIEISEVLSHFESNITFHEMFNSGDGKICDFLATYLVDHFDITCDELRVRYSDTSTDIGKVSQVFAKHYPRSSQLTTLYPHLSWIYIKKWILASPDHENNTIRYLKRSTEFLYAWHDFSKLHYTPLIFSLTWLVWSKFALLIFRPIVLMYSRGRDTLSDKQLHHALSDKENHNELIEIFSKLVIFLFDLYGEISVRGFNNVSNIKFYDDLGTAGDNAVKSNQDLLDRLMQFCRQGTSEFSDKCMVSIIKVSYELCLVLNLILKHNLSGQVAPLVLFTKREQQSFLTDDIDNKVNDNALSSTSPFLHSPFVSTLSRITDSFATDESSNTRLRFMSGILTCIVRSRESEDSVDYDDVNLVYRLSESWKMDENQTKAIHVFTLFKFALDSKAYELLESMTSSVSGTLLSYYKHDLIVDKLYNLAIFRVTKLVYDSDSHQRSRTLALVKPELASKFDLMRHRREDQQFVEQMCTCDVEKCKQLVMYLCSCSELSDDSLGVLYDCLSLLQMMASDKKSQHMTRNPNNSRA